MDICEEIISQPYIKYEVKVSHVTPRKSTAFEWLFLETLVKAEGTEFHYERMEDFFKNYFRIDNPQKLILPLLKRLYDLRAVSCDKLTDEISLSELMLRDVQILSLGKEMQKKGLLPGEHSDDVLDVVYDVSQKKLVTEKNNFKDKAEGNYIDIEEVNFPERQVREYIEEQRPKNNKGKKIDWLKDNTEIDSVTLSASKRCFVNSKKEVQLKDGLIWKIKGNKFVELDETSLEYFENIVPDAFANCITDCPVTAISKPDSEITQIVLFKDLENRIKSYLKNYKISIIDSVLFKSDENQSKSESKKNKKEDISFVISDNSSNFSVNIKKNRLIVTIPEKILPANSLYMSENFSMCVEKFPIKAGDISKELIFAYLPKNSKTKIDDYILTIVKKNYKQNTRVLLLLSDKEDLFYQYLNQLLSNCTPKEKNNKIYELNKDSDTLLGKKIISEDTIFDLIIDKNQICVRDFTSAKEIIEEYTSLSLVKNKTLKSFLQLVIEKINPSDSLEEIWDFIKIISSTSNDVFGYLNNQNYLNTLYSDEAKKIACVRTFENKIEKPHCRFEEGIKKLADIYEKINKEDNPKKLKELFNNWKNTYNSFNKKNGIIETLDKFNTKVKQKSNSMLEHSKGGK